MNERPTAVGLCSKVFVTMGFGLKSSHVHIIILGSLNGDTVTVSSTVTVDYIACLLADGQPTLRENK